MSRSSPETDRNLVFGILALQLSLVEQDDLIDAMNAWLLAKNRPLGELLCERGALDDESRDLIDRLVAKRISRHDGSAADTLSSLAAVSTDVHDRLAKLDPELEQSLSRVPPWRERVAVQPTQVAPQMPTSDGRFSVLRLHARGGLGEVFLAEDRELHRQVALKQIQSSHAGRESSRARFLLEAEITGSLEHPGIVPVYGLGFYDDGRPYYAMRFIRGESLQQRVEQYHQARQSGTRPPGELMLEFRKLLTHFIAVCQAIDYAHSRGVIHRDLKPSNIMLGKYGETLVVDWGLAKTVGRDDQTKARGDEATLVPRLSSREQLRTLMGQAVGTPSFMSPEQAEGRVDRVGPPSDVYSLGATLYTVLTNRPPFAGPVEKVLTQVQAGDVVPPRILEPSAPRPLEAVCLKAMRCDPQDRYASPRELAEEVEAFLADEPVRAWTEPVPARLARWGRKHKSAVSVTAIAASILLAVLAASVALLGAKNRQVAAAEEKAANNFNQARRAVEDLAQVGIEVLADQPGLQPVQREILSTAVDYYRRFVRDHRGDHALEASVAASLQMLGTITGKIGSHQEAARTLRAAVADWEHLAELDSTAADRGAGLAKSLAALGVVLIQTGEFAEASRALDRARGLYERLARENSSNPQYAEGLARAVINQAHLEAFADPQIAARMIQEALAPVERLQRRNPNEARWRLLRAKYHLNRGSHLMHAYQLDAAISESAQAREILADLVADFPYRQDFRSGLAKAWSNLGMIYTYTDRLAEAADCWQQAIDAHDQLATWNPLVVEYKLDHAKALNQLAVLRAKRKEQDDATRAFDQARRILVQLRAEHPSLLEPKTVLSEVLMNVAAVRAEAGDQDAVTAAFSEARGMLEAHLDGEPKDLLARRTLVDLLHGQATIKDTFKNTAAADALYADALDHQRIIGESSRATGVDRKKLSDMLWNYGDRSLTRGAHAEAAAIAEERIRRWSHDSDELYYAAWEFARCHAAAGGDGGSSEQETTSTQTYLQRSLSALAAAVDAGFNDIEQLQTNRDLAPLRTTPAYAEIVRTITMDGPASSDRMIERQID